MNLAPANTVGGSSTAFVTARSTGSGAQGAGTRSLSQSADEFDSFDSGASDKATLSPYIARYPTVALTFNEDASRLIMLFRDPETGHQVSQIPSEVVVKQYEEAQQAQRKQERPNYQVVVDGASASKTDGAKGAGSVDAQTGAGVAVQDGSVVTGVSVSGPGGGGSGYSTAVSGGASGGFTVASTGSAPAGGSYGGGSYGVSAGQGAGSVGTLGAGSSGGASASLNLVI